MQKYQSLNTPFFAVTGKITPMVELFFTSLIFSKPLLWRHGLLTTANSNNFEWKSIFNHAYPLCSEFVISAQVHLLLSGSLPYHSWSQGLLIVCSVISIFLKSTGLTLLSMTVPLHWSHCQLGTHSGSKHPNQVYTGFLLLYRPHPGVGRAPSRECQSSPTNFHKRPLRHHGGLFNSFIQLSISPEAQLLFLLKSSSIQISNPNSTWQSTNDIASMFINKWW